MLLYAYMKLEITPEDYEKLIKIDSIAQKPHRAVCGYSGGGDTSVYAHIELGVDFINNLKKLAINDDNATLQFEIRKQLDNFLEYIERQAKNTEIKGI